MEINSFQALSNEREMDYYDHYYIKILYIISKLWRAAEVVARCGCLCYCVFHHVFP